jgi:hypothetical protein
MQENWLRFAPLGLLLIALCSSTGLYWPGLYGPVVLDDIATIGQFFDPELAADDFPDALFSDTGLLKRPVSMATFAINALATPDLFYWKLTNLVIHLFTGIVVYLLTVRLLRATQAGSELIAAVVASAWLLHPLHISTVLYTVQRMTELSAFFVLAALLIYTIARQRQQDGLRGSLPLQLIAWLFLFPLGVFSKENALLFPGFVILLEVFILSRHRLDDKRLLRIALAAVPFIAIVIVVLWPWFLSGYATRPFTLTERLYTEGRVLIEYLAMLLIPAQSRMGFLHDDMQISTTLLSPWTTLPSLAVIAALIIAAFSIRHKHPLIGFGILFFFLGHAMESSIIPLDIMYEHRNYLPSFGVILSAVVASSVIIKNRRILVPFATLFFALLMLVSYVGTTTWGSLLLLFDHMETVHPRSPRLAMIKANQLAEIGEFDLARQRLKSFSSLGATLQRLHIECLETRRLSDDQLMLDPRELKFADNYATIQLAALSNLGLDGMCEFAPERFLALLEQVERNAPLTPTNQRLVLMYLSHFLWKTQQQDRALATLNRLFSIDQKNPIPLFLACDWLLDSHRFGDARTTCDKALRVVQETRSNRYDEFATNARARLKAVDLDAPT